MFDFQKLCDRCEHMTVLQKVRLLAEKAPSVFARLETLGTDTASAKKTLAAFMLGSIADGGELDEMEYLLMYPSLLRVFGDKFDFSGVKRAFESGGEEKSRSRDYIRGMTEMLAGADENLRSDIVSLCLMMATVDGKISLSERNYIKQLVN